MAVTLNASSTAGFVTTADTSTILQLQTNGTTAVTVDDSQRVAFVAGTAALPAITTTGDTNTGIFFPAADTIAFAEGGVEAMRIDSSGRLSIGGTTVTDGHLLNIQGSAATHNIGIVLNKTNSTAQIWGITNTGPLAFYDYTASAERARIDTSGNLLVGVTSTTQSHKIAGKVASAWNTQFISEFSTAANNYGITCQYTQAAPNNGSNQFFEGQDTAGSKVSLRSNGGIANYSANNVNLSDRREKTNFAPSKSYLDVICAIPVQTYNYIDQNLEEDDGLTLGVVAQDVQAVAPELVTESNWAGYDQEPKMRLSIYQTDMQYALMKCIQEQQALIESLTQRITSLEAKP
jgi:hypothetical protein